MEEWALRYWVFLLWGVVVALPLYRSLRGLGWRRVRATIVGTGVAAEDGAPPRQEGDSVRTDGFVPQVVCAFDLDGRREAVVHPTAAGRSFFLKARDAERSLAMLQPGATRDIWVNPRDPAQAALKRVDLRLVVQTGLLGVCLAALLVVDRLRG